MMKKVLFTLLSMVIVGITACAQKKEDKKEENKMKILVAYFSATGTTEQVAKELAAVVGGDLYAIQPEKPYTDADLNWTNDKSRSSVEMKNLKFRPAIKGKVENIEAYNVVYVGFPIWWYTAPTIINTFIESYDFSGKTVIPFATSGGSTITKSAEDLKRTYPNIKWGKGKLLNGTSKKELQDWVKGN